MFSKNTILTLLGICGFLVVGAVFGLYSKQFYTSPPFEPVPGLLWPNPKQLTEFQGTDHTGAAFDLHRLRGKWSLLFFGYTHCPDVCPMTLSILSSLQDELPEGMQTLFITVDPGRDTTQRLADYISFYDDRMTGLGGSTEQVSALAAQIGVAWGHGETMPDGNYIVTHSSAVFLTDPEARLVGIFSAPLEPDSLLASINRIRDFVSSQQ